MFQDEENNEFEDQEEKLEKATLEYQSQFRGMMNKYQLLLMQESMVSYYH